ncbi:unnamed protein product [Cercospora beticola]|nr:unnamed protein product [Cercospora beticola]
MGGLMDAIRNEPIERMVEAIVPRVLLPYKTQATFLSEIAHADPSPPGETCCFCRDSDRQASSIPPCNHQVCLKCILKTMPQYDNRCGICRAYW